LVGSSAHLTEKTSQKLISDIRPTMDGVLLLSQPGFNELTRVDRPSFTLMGWYRSPCGIVPTSAAGHICHPGATRCRVKASWDVPGYVVRKPLGLVGAAYALPYALKLLCVLFARYLMGAVIAAIMEPTFVCRCWAWKFGPDFRALEFGAHDYGLAIGIDDAKRLYEHVNVRPRKFAALRCQWRRL
jgi:hypothetical protein